VEVVVNKLLIRYDVKGQGPALLLLHGWGDSAAGLKELQVRLSSKYKVIAVDLPGFGLSEGPQEAWDLSNYASFLGALVSKLSIGKLHAVIGHSNGGALAIYAIATGKLKADKLVLIAAAGIRSGRTVRRFIFLVLAKAGKVLTIWLPRRYRIKLRQRLYGAAGSDMLAVPTLEQTFKKTVRQDVKAEAAKLNLPTLLIYAHGDQAVPIEYGQRYHELIKGSTLEVIDSPDHFIHRAEPERVSRLIEEFL